MDRIEIDPYFFQNFEKGFNPRYPERGAIPVRVLGYGEISTVLEIMTDDMGDLACKRMPMFKSATEVENYLKVYEQYLRVLEHQIGLNLIPSKTAWTAKFQIGPSLISICKIQSWKNLWSWPTSTPAPRSCAKTAKNN